MIAIPDEENGQRVTRYFNDEAAADEAMADAGMRAALNAIGAWRDLDWDEMIDVLDRIRHENPPTPLETMAKVAAPPGTEVPGSVKEVG